MAQVTMAMKGMNFGQMMFKSKVCQSFSIYLFFQFFHFFSHFITICQLGTFYFFSLQDIPLGSCPYFSLVF